MRSVVTLIILNGCGFVWNTDSYRGDEPLEDAGRDASDGSVDSAFDSALDSAFDAPADVPMDAPTDAGSDVAMDVGIDATTDVGTDGSIDVGTDAPIDAGPTDASGCTPGTTRTCPDGIGVCGGGTETCVSPGRWNGICEGETLPAPYEECSNGLDDDCNGSTSETGDDCCFTRSDRGKTYAFCHRGRAGWGTVALRCESWGMYLVAIEDATENAFVEANALASSWIGLSDITTEGVYVWRTAGAGYTNWDTGDGQPDGGPEDCVAISHTTGFWSDEQCSTSRAFVCETP